MDPKTVQASHVTNYEERYALLLPKYLASTMQFLGQDKKLCINGKNRSSHFTYSNEHSQLYPARKVDMIL